jgi:hypothetical protein
LHVYAHALRSQLSADTLKLLQDFRNDQDAQAKQFEKLKSEAESNFENGGTFSMDMFGEDWNASQFWYTDETARTLAKQLLKDVKEDSAIAVVSAPSVYVAIRNILSETPLPFKIKLRLLEFDRRFEVFGGDFVFYDFENPLRLTNELRGGFDRIICDPPFLSEDCQTKAAMSARFLARTWSKEGEKDLRFITCTGERCGELLKRLYSQLGVRTTTFQPKHSKGLSNEFCCYANFECEDWSWQ